MDSKIEHILAKHLSNLPDKFEQSYNLVDIHRSSLVDIARERIVFRSNVLHNKMKINK